MMMMMMCLQSKGSTDAMTTVNITTEIDSGLCGEEFDLNTDYVIAGELVMHTPFILSVCPSVRPSVGRSVSHTDT